MLDWKVNLFVQNEISRLWRSSSLAVDRCSCESNKTFIYLPPPSTVTLCLNSDGDQDIFTDQDSELFMSLLLRFAFYKRSVPQWFCISSINVNCTYQETWVTVFFSPILCTHDVCQSNCLLFGERFPETSSVSLFVTSKLFSLRFFWKSIFFLNRLSEWFLTDQQEYD